GEILAQVSPEGVKAVLESCLEWDACVPVRNFQLAQYSASILQHEGGWLLFQIKGLRGPRKLKPQDLRDWKME
ncbi:unnamed protein product, partial [Coregonus sp. 'balchen']